MSELFSAFDFDEGEVKEINRVYSKDQGIREPRVCICGHTMKGHRANISAPGETQCRVTKVYCPCIAARPVISVSDTRYFVRNTIGNGARHALMRGIEAAQSNDKKEVEIEWLIDLKCDEDGCGKTEGLTVVNLTVHGIVLPDRPAEFSVFLCKECRLKREGRPQIQSVATPEEQ